MGDTCYRCGNGRHNGYGLTPVGDEGDFACSECREFVDAVEEADELREERDNFAAHIKAARLLLESGRYSDALEVLKKSGVV